MSSWSAPVRAERRPPSAAPKRGSDARAGKEGPAPGQGLLRNGHGPLGPRHHPESFRDHSGKGVDVPPGIERTSIPCPRRPSRALDWPTPLAWRKDLDAWLMQKAKAAGAEIRERARVTQVEPHGQTIRLMINGPDGDETLPARWVIGADGANSAIRKSLFPEMKVAYVTPVRECYAGSLTLDKNYLHWFFPRGLPRPRFNVNHKGDFFLIEGSGIRELREDINRILAAYGWDPSQPPVWRDGCLIPKIHQQIMDGSFHPARGNILLVGDAAGLIFPITFEGIGSALKSGLLAAEAILQASRSGGVAAESYLDELQPVLTVIAALLSCQEDLTGSASSAPSEPGGMARRLKKAYQKTLQIG